jgi:hypothetical protein
MERLINDFFTGLVVIAIFGGVHGCTKVIGMKAVESHKKGLMSYKEYTKLLTK